MKRAAALTLAAILSSSCSTNRVVAEWQPERLAAKTVHIHFLSEKEWIDMQEHLHGCQNEASCYLLYESTLGIAFYKREPCEIYFPAHKGLPSYHVIRHELRHCYQGSHADWKRRD